MNVLVIAAHPDDEVLGCGATMAKHARQGDVVHILILAEGATSRATNRDRSQWKSEISALAKASYQAGDILGAKSVTLRDFPDNRMDSCELLDVVKTIEQAIAQHRPEVIYTHHAGDVNVDHRRIHEAVVTACRPVPRHPVKSLLMFEVPSSTEWQIPGSAPLFSPNWFEDVTTTIHLKLEALEAYELEMRSWPHPRSLKAIEYLARWRGSSVGYEAAEAFVLGRRLQ
jgi:LmbE family N-acetylglucosaminyl deacetylase